MNKAQIKVRLNFMSLLLKIQLILRAGWSLRAYVIGVAGNITGIFRAIQ
jgi:hypothetical protein